MGSEGEFNNWEPTKIPATRWSQRWLKLKTIVWIISKFKIGEIWAFSFYKKIYAYVFLECQTQGKQKKFFWIALFWNMAGIGLMMESEKEILEMVEAKTAMTNYWIPLTWATNIINRARREHLISNDHMVQTILLEMSDIRYRLGSLIGYDNVNIPILYSQVGIANYIIQRYSGGVMHA